ncbi:hypothetical protein [Nocardia sp. JMUB6875]|uniref:hypothetical protein n=1 Tax=Nocardia sp. JMUB6875 TaxID=3158170 RepID=UPI0034E8CF93
MLVLGVALLIAGYFLVIPLLTVAGLVVLVLGGLLMLAGMNGHAIGRRHYY